MGLHLVAIMFKHDPAGSNSCTGSCMLTGSGKRAGTHQSPHLQLTAHESSATHLGIETNLQTLPAFRSAVARACLLEKASTLQMPSVLGNL